MDLPSSNRCCLRVNFNPYAKVVYFGVVNPGTLQVLGLSLKQVVKENVTKHGNVMYYINLNYYRSRRTYDHP